MKKDNELDSKKKRMKEELLAREAEHKAKKHRTTVYSATDEEKLRKFYEEQEARVKRESWRKFREETSSSSTQQSSSEEHNNVNEEDLDPGATIKISWDSSKGSYNEIKLRTLFSKYGNIEYILVKHKKAYIAFKNSYSAYVALEQETGDTENQLKIKWGRKNKVKPETAATKKMEPINTIKQNIINNPTPTFTIPKQVPLASQHKELESMVFANLRRAAETQKRKEPILNNEQFHTSKKARESVIEMQLRQVEERKKIRGTNISRRKR